MRERLLRSDVFEHERSRREDFDPIAEGIRYGLAPEVSAALWDRVRREATNGDGLCDENAARLRFAQLAELLATRGGQLGPEPFHWTQIDVAMGRVPSHNLLTERVPGRTTLVLAEASARARAALYGVPGRTTLVAHHVDSDVSSLDESRGFFQRYVNGGHTARAKLERAIAARDHYAAVIATGALKQDLALARRHLANGLEGEEGLRAELAALERPAEQLLAKLPNMSAGGRPWELWGPSSAEWRTAIGEDVAHARRDEPRAPERLPASLQDRMERAYGRRFDDVELHRESAEVPAGQRAITRGRHIHLERGAIDLTAARGELVLAHELAHVAQQDGRGERTGTRQELEREAARAATRAVRGQTARVALRAEATAAYAFSEDHEHDVDELGHAATGEPNEKHPSTNETTEHHAADDGVESGVEEVSAVVPAEDAQASTPHVAGGPAAKPHKEPPNVAQAKPERGLGELRGVRPDQLGSVLGTAHAAATADVTQTRTAHQANPPKMTSTGAAYAVGANDKDAAHAAAPSTAGKGAAPRNAPPKGQTGKDAAPRAAVATEAAPAAVAAPAAKEAAERPVKAEVPGGEADKRAAQGAATEQQKTAGEVITHVASAIASWFGSWSSWFGHHDDASSQGTQDAKMSDDESRQMASSVDQIPTAASGVSTDVGPAPELAMKGEAKDSADRERAAFEAKTAAAEAQGRADSRGPMGEDQIDTTAPPEELTAMSVGADAPAATPAAAMPSLASAPSEEVGIVAQEQHGVEIDAALAKASADVGAERAKHAEHEARMRAESDAEVRELKSKADADQAAARESAQAEAGAARSQWQAEIDKHGADARKQADRKVAEGMAQVEAEEAKANAEAKRHIEEGQKKAEQERQKGEKEAADAKEKAKHKSSGFWGWVSSKAKAAFDGVKKAVSSAIDACRRAVKAVIEGAKKLAMAAIELARKAINAAIKAIGQALIAISDVLLAAFPELKARFQGLIRKAVDKATAAVNRLADGLKQAVQKALDKLGAALDQALQLLEKGIHAIIDAASAVVQGAIKAAQAIVEALGTWAKLIKDVASGPGAWLGKLGAAVVDGIKNHLWSAFKTTVVEWFKSKVFELLGVGGLILELLLEGGLTREQIIQMAMDALIVAIPAALIAILVEKLVSMIVPAAGAVMAIIEGLQAAWGTISRIIAAFSAFVGFLLAVKSGSAGPLFAGLLAAAAVVVLDFVANWLLRKLASVARKVGAKLKGLAEKFRSKRKHHDGSPGKPSHAAHADSDEKHSDRDGAKSKEEKRQDDVRKRVEKAQKELPPKVSRLLAKKPSRLRVLAQFTAWRLRYRLTKLELRGTEGKVDIFAQVNPTITLAPGWTFKSTDVFRAIDRIAGGFLTEARTQRAAPPRETEDGSLDLNDRTHASDPAAHFGPAPSSYRVGKSESGDDLGYRHETVAFGWGRIKPLREGSGSNYSALQKKLEGVDVGTCLGKLTRNEPVGNLSPEQRGALEELYGLWMGGKEASHPKGTFGHQRDLTHSYMLGQLMENKSMSLEEAISLHPASFGGAQKGAGHVTAEMADENARLPGEGTKERNARDERRRREKATTQTWFKHHESELKTWFQQRLATEGPMMEREPTIHDVEEFVRYQLRKYLQRQ